MEAMDRGSRGELAEDAPDGTSATLVQVKKGPRVGGEIDGVPWTGGSNVASQQTGQPEDVQCFRPQGFRDMQRQHEALRRGLDDTQKLDLVKAPPQQLD